MNPSTIVLEGRFARLEPLTLAHATLLFAAADHDDIWRYMPYPRPRLVGELERWVGVALEELDLGNQLPFAIVDRASGRAVGSTRYLDIRRPHRGLEIGWTWLAPEHRRTALNTECKLLLLSHAFDALGALRVQLKTDARNERSQRAIERIGAKREGVLRQHVVMPDGFVRDTVMYSIVANEWPSARTMLEAKLDR